ncbi:Tbc2 translation factor, chloroplastic [Porphyridium purpureum]|uniref:Tbc2 translation factor, chloroplastic n=1 Tax=Porphyridium purpureum TaxID=35688 RepID=A0A5J4YJ91_PORPP|nr:Tbc2 translation factor, chloroplastic [Porphyridium purpureum]|eukprot:POR8152..scf261_15
MFVHSHAPLEGTRPGTSVSSRRRRHGGGVALNDVGVGVFLSRRASGLRLRQLVLTCASSKQGQGKEQGRRWQAEAESDRDVVAGVNDDREPEFEQNAENGVSTGRKEIPGAENSVQANLDEQVPEDPNEFLRWIDQNIAKASGPPKKPASSSMPVNGASSPLASSSRSSPSSAQPLQQRQRVFRTSAKNGTGRTVRNTARSSRDANEAKPPVEVSRTRDSVGKQHLMRRLRELKQELYPVEIDGTLNPLDMWKGRWFCSLQEIVESGDCDAACAARALRLLVLLARQSIESFLTVRRYLEVSEFMLYFERVTSASMPTVHHVPLSAFLHAFATLEFTPSRRWTQLWLARAENVYFDVQGLPNVLWALAKLQIAPTEPLLNNWYAAFGREQRKFKAQGIANVMWAFARLQVQPERRFLRDWVACFQREAELRAFNAQALSNIIWALARLNINFKKRLSGFLSSWYQAYADKHDEFNSQGVANCVWAFGRLEIQPSQSFLSIWGSDFARVHEQMNSQALANCLWSLARVSIPLSFLPPAFVDLWCRGFERELFQFSPQALANTLWSFGRLELRPPAYFWDLWFDAFGRAAVHFNAQELGNAMWALGRLEYAPAPAFLESWYYRFSCVEPHADSQCLSNSLWGLARLEEQPRSSFLELWYLAADREMTNSQCSAQALSNMMWAHGKLGITPRDTFLDAWYNACRSEQDALEPQALANTIWAFSRLGIRPREEFMKSWVTLFNKSAESTSEETLSMYENAFERLLSMPTLAGREPQSDSELDSDPEQDEPAAFMK